MDLASEKRLVVALLGQQAQCDRLGEDAAAEVVEVEALVGAVRPAGRIGYPGEQDGRLGKRLLERRNERDRTADARSRRSRCPTPRANAAPVGVVGGALASRGRSHRLRPPASPSTSAPHGTFASRCATSAAMARCGSSPGAIRRLTLALADGSSWLIASATGGASMARTETARHRPRAARHRARADQLGSGQGAGLAPQFVLGEVERVCVVPRPGREWPRCPCSSWSVASVRHSTVSASGKAPPNWPLCTPCSSVRTSMTQSTRPRSDVVSAGVPTRQFSESAITMTSAARRSRVLLQERLEVERADLFLAFDEDLHADRRSGAVGPNRSEVDGDAGLVVCGAAAVQPAVAFGRARRPVLSRCRPGPGAARRGGHRAGPSVRPVGAGISPKTAGCAPSTSRIWVLAEPASCISSATALAERRTSAGSNPSALTEGMRTRLSRSERMEGSRWSTAVARSLCMSAKATGAAAVRAPDRWDVASTICSGDSVILPGHQSAHRLTRLSHASKGRER